MNEERLQASIFVEKDQEGNVVESEIKFDGLTDSQIWAYGVGHFINDLTAACWFNYLFFFLKKVVQTEAAAAALLTGQICDGIATPIVGILSDKLNFRIGQRKPWYIGGLILVVTCFIPIFSGYKGEKTTQYLLYTIFPGMFNIGWASLQISHMSLVPALTCSRKRRDKLNNLRNLFTFVSNFAVLGVGLILFSVLSDKKLEYQLICYVSVGLGLITSILFLVKIDEPRLVKQCIEKAKSLTALLNDARIRQSEVDSKVLFQSQSENEQDPNPKERLLNWFKIPKFYLFGICYMSVRLYVNLFGTLLPFYIIDVLKMDIEDKDKVSFNIALVPMIAYFSSCIVSTRLNQFYKTFGRKRALLIGTLTCVVCMTAMFFLTPNSYQLMYLLALSIGFSQSLVLSTGINLISDVVGGRAKTGAFVFGAYSLLDKFSSGIIIFIIGNTEAYSKQSKYITDEDSTFIRYTMILVPGAACVLSSLIVLTYPIEEYKKGPNNVSTMSKKSQIEQELVV